MKHAIRLATWVTLAAATLAAAPATRPASLAGESHQISSVSRGDLLRPRGASSKEGTPIVLYPHQDWKCLTWKFEPAGDDGAVRLINYFTNKTLCPDGRDDGAPVTQHQAGKEPTDAQRWRFAPVADNVYRIEHAATGKVLSVTSDGNVVIQQWSDAPAQKWKLLDKPAHFTG